jgi:tetratricopeptide (TPR) repeat protein
MKGNLKESETYICLALEIKKQLDNKHEIASSLNDYVVLLSVKGKYKEALSRAEEALNIYKEIGDQNGAAIATANVSNLNIQFGNLDLAYIQSADTLIEAERVEVNDLIAGLLCNIVSILIIRGELSEVVSMSNKAMGFATKSQNTMTLSLVNLTIGSCYKELGDFALAERYFTEALDKIRSDGIKCQLLMALIFLAEAYIRVGKISEAKNACLEGKKISAEFENSFSAAQFDRILGQINSAERHWQKAEKFFKKGINYFNGYGALPELAITYKELGLMFLSNGNQINAIQALESAETIFTDLGAENQVLVIRSIKNA